ncbi:MAG: hypothetical protein IPH18_10185 [Chitinophagaceae bacterium]|nr:hypothetical protein [Chitinophagaceae bacterium]MBK8952077.1 hypothetical protein [Chitinophagaceae bacterium]
MTRKDNILQELSELNSSLGANAGQHPYQVPAGYFDNLAENVLTKIKTQEAATAHEELMHLSPLLAGLSKEMPYSIPQGYFEQLAVPLNAQTAAEELSSLSPFLSGFKKENPYSVPDGYFENLSSAPYGTVIKPQAKVVSITSRRWFRYAAAAVVTGLIIMAGFIIKNGKVDPSENSYAWVKKNIKKVSTEKIDEFVTLAEEENLVNESVAATSDNKIQEIKELIKDVPENEIQSLLNDTQVLDDTDDAAEEMMN